MPGLAYWLERPGFDTSQRHEVLLPPALPDRFVAHQRSFTGYRGLLPGGKATGT